MTHMADALSTALLHFVWQGIAGGVLWGILMLMLSKSSANSRYVASCIVLAALALAPAITFGSIWQAAVVPLRTSVSAASGSLPPLVVSATSGPVPQTLLGSLESWVLPLWAAGVLVFTLRLAWAGGYASSLRRQGVRADSAIESMIAGLAERMGVQQKLRVLMSSVAEVPAVVGWIRPVILLPAAVVVGLTPRQLESLLAHELAHIRRYDYFVNILQMIVETFLFYHPAVWLVSERIRVERELCCDDLAVGFCGDVLSYARALSQLEKLRPAAPSLAMGSAYGPLFQRIQRLLGRGRYEHVPSRLACAAGLLTGFLCLGWFLNARAQQREPLPAMTELTPVSEEVPPIPPIPSLLSSPSAVSAQTAPSSPVAPPLAPALAAPALAAPAPAAPALAAPALAAPTLAAPALAAPALAAPAPAAPAAPAAPQDITRLPVLSNSPAPPASPMAILPLLQDLSLSPQSPWVLFRGNTLIARAGAAEEEQAKRARASLTGDVLWFQLDGKTFITQDKDVIDQIEAAGTETLRRQQIEPNGILLARLQVAQAARQASQFQVERQTLDQRRAIQELQSSFEQASRSLRNTAGADAAAQQQRDLERLGVQMSNLQAEISRMEAVTAQREAELRAAESQLAAAQRNAEQGVLREVEILRGAVREGKAQIVP